VTPLQQRRSHVIVGPAALGSQNKASLLLSPLYPDYANESLVCASLLSSKNNPNLINIIALVKTMKKLYSILFILDLLCKMI